MVIQIRKASILFLVTAFLASSSYAQVPTAIFPAIITFGDSTVDVGNNNHIVTGFKANYPPYGRDFINHKPTGRFCNGKLAVDITAEAMGFKTYAPPYLSPAASGKNLLKGANFASAAAGYDERAAISNHGLTLTQQLKFYKEYQIKLGKVAGKKKAGTIIKEALYILSVGSGDFLQNYYINSSVNNAYTPDQYSSFLVRSCSSFIKELYSLGARKIGVTSLPPMGCFPAAISLFGNHNKGCVSRINDDVQLFNKKLNSSSTTLQKQLPGLKIVVFNIYTPLYDVIHSPSQYGFTEVRKSCCRTGTVGRTSVLCYRRSLPTCRNATQYVFWDSVHPSEAANQVIADALFLQGLAFV